jgi:outer membrane protein
MRVFVVVLALSLVLAAAPSFAQAPPAAPDQPAPAAAQTAKPAPPPAQVAPAQPQRVPFGVGLKYAIVNLQEIAQTSVQGKAFNAKVQALQEQKAKELQDKQKQIQANQDKLEKGASVLNDQARAQLQLDIERQTKDLQRANEDAQQELQTLIQALQGQFEQVLGPVIDRVAREKQVHFVFDAAQAGLVWADPSMDLTPDVVKALDASGPAKPAAAAPPPAAPQKPAAAPTQQK